MTDQQSLPSTFELGFVGRADRSVVKASQLQPNTPREFVPAALIASPKGYPKQENGLRISPAMSAADWNALVVIGSPGPR